MQHHAASYDALDPRSFQATTSDQSKVSCAAYASFSSVRTPVFASGSCRTYAVHSVAVRWISPRRLNVLISVCLWTWCPQNPSRGWNGGKLQKQHCKPGRHGRSAGGAVLTKSAGSTPSAVSKTWFGQANSRCDSNVG